MTWRLVVRGFLEGKIGAQTAGSFFLSKERIRPSSYWARARVGPSCRRGWHGLDPKNWKGPRQTIQTEVFAFDLAQALAPVLPDAALSGSAEAFPTLSKDDKDELIDLRIAYGTQAQIPVLETIVRDDHRENTERRVKVASKIAALAPRGRPCRNASSTSSDRTSRRLRQAAVRAIER